MNGTQNASAYNPRKTAGSQQDRETRAMEWSVFAAVSADRPIRGGSELSCRLEGRCVPEGTRMTGRKSR